MIDYLWKEFKLYLPSIEMKASYIMEFNKYKLGERYAFSCVVKCMVWTMKGNADTIENLLEDEQGLSMGEMLTGNFRQPRLLVIHWFQLWFATNPPLGIEMM
jgi:hypothetical protein